MGDNSVRVAVRVRPFNDREKEMKAKLVIQMEGASTTITNPESNEVKTFAFDFSYWSHDGYVEQPDGIKIPAPGSRYAAQRTVFDDLGKDILDNAFEGYNCSLFAYGQTGSGKSYSMVGYGPNKGIIPIICEEMFKRVESNTDKNISYQVTVSMLEIYNEQVKDLLNIKSNKPGGLKVRNKPGMGNYVEGLTPVPVTSYATIEAQMEEGTKNRTVASTKMNATSSRAHTVFTVMFTTTRIFNDQKNEMTSKINLVDLAGSERADSTGATGDRLKEGSAINQSLSALGNVISALAELSQGKKKVFVPYRNSVLTRLLQDALGGNSKTIMIAALSPADVNYDETLSTLRYADRAKKIKNNVTKNENPTEKIIRDLKEENERLLKMLSDKGLDPTAMISGGQGGEEAERLKTQLEEQMRENQRLMEEMGKSWEQKLKEAMERAQENSSDGALSAATAKGTGLPYIINLHEDPQLSECVMYVFKQGGTKIGRSDAPEKQDIVLSGLNIKSQHATVTNDGAQVVLTPLESSKTFINGDLVTKPTQLADDDRIIIGNNFVFRVHLPQQAKADATHFTWQQAMEEFATKQGLRLQQDVDGRVNKLEQEEAEKRRELEERLKKMEEEIRLERERAAKALQEQRSVFESRLQNGEITEEEKARLRGIEETFQKKTETLNAELEKKKEMSEHMLQEQIKRKRDAKKVEEQLAHLMPLVTEANSMAEELNKSVRFEARLTVKAPKTANLSPIDELKQLKKIEVAIRVTNQSDGSIWNWSPSKFENRLYMMRELYQEFNAYGVRELEPSADPWSDPPEPFEIGKAYVYLKALSQLVEIDADFMVVDYKGENQGQLHVELVPQGPNGEELEYLQKSEGIVGMRVGLNVKITSAKNLPARYANDVMVQYEFMENPLESAVAGGSSGSPTFDYHRMFDLGVVTEELRQYLLKDAIIFEVKGYTEAQSRQLRAMQALQASQNPTSQLHGSNGALCEQCEEQHATVDCMDCQRIMCESCFVLLHKSAKKQEHRAQAIQNPALQGQGGEGAICEQCEEQMARVHCVDCTKNLCGECEALLHKSAKKQAHVRQPIEVGTFTTAGTAAPAYPCQQCEEQNALVQCIECERVFCSDCNELLHKSAKKKEHQRVAVSAAVMGAGGGMQAALVQ